MSSNFTKRIIKQEIINELLKFNKNINHVCIHEYVKIYQNYVLKFNLFCE